MRITGYRYVLTASLIALSAICHAETVPGAYTEGPGLKFFESLRFGVIDYAPATFEEVVENASVIARGKLTAVIPGRSIGTYSSMESQPWSTVFVKIVPSRVLKGDREDYYLVEILTPVERVPELSEQLYTGDLLFLLQPAGNMLIDPKISVSPEAEAEWLSGKSLYALSRRSTLFTISGAGELASPLDAYRGFEDLYTRIGTLEDLESHIASVQAGQTNDDAQTGGGSRDWYENPDRAPRGLVEERYESGRLKSEMTYYEGVMNGPARYWYENGQLQAEANFEGGKMDGPGRYWHQNGQLALRASFRDGRRVQCEAWMQDGSPVDCSNLSPEMMSLR